MQYWITVSDGEGSDGGIAVALINARQPHLPAKLVATTVPSSIRAEWQRRKQQDIADIEMIAPLAAMNQWPELAAGLGLHFTDSQTAKCGLVKGNSQAVTAAPILHATWRRIWERQLLLYTDYVNTHDNPTDDASRGNITMHGMDFVREEPVADIFSMS